MNELRKYTIIVGSKNFFGEQVDLLTRGNEIDISSSFPQMVRCHDEYNRRVRVKINNQPSDDDYFEQTDLLIIENTDYHSIAETAHDRLPALIEEITTEDAQIFIHNPPKTLKEHLQRLVAKNDIELHVRLEEYDIVRCPKKFSQNMSDISERIIGQPNALNEIAKSMWYLTRIDRKKPFVIMLYGNSSIGKTEMVREVSAAFFDGKVFEKHLSMFKNNNSGDYLFGRNPNRTSIGFDLLERQSNLVFLDEFDKLPDYFHSIFYTLFDNTNFEDATYQVDVSGLLIFLTSNYSNLDEMKRHLGLPIFYRIDKFIHFQDFSAESIHIITKKEIDKHMVTGEEQLDADVLYERVCDKIKATDENARTIKNVILQEVENMLFEQFESDVTK